MACRNKGGLNLLDLAYERNHTKCIKLLEMRGARRSEDTKFVGRKKIEPVVIAHEKEPELPPHKLTEEEWELCYKTGLWLIEEMLYAKVSVCPGQTGPGVALRARLATRAGGKCQIATVYSACASVHCRHTRFLISA